MEADADRWIKPDFRRFLLLGAIAWSLFTAVLSILIAGIAIWWPSHPVMQDSTWEIVAGLVWAPGLFAAEAVLLSWLLNRHKAWRVGPAGIAFFRGGRLRRSLVWSDIHCCKVKPSGVFVGSMDHSVCESFEGLGSEDAKWLDEYSKERLRKRISH